MIYQPVFCLVLQGAKRGGDRQANPEVRADAIAHCERGPASRVTLASAAQPYIALAFELDMTAVLDLVEDIGATSERFGGHAADTVPADELVLDEFTDRRFRSQVVERQMFGEMRALVLDNPRQTFIADDVAALDRSVTSH